MNRVRIRGRHGKRCHPRVGTPLLRVLEAANGHQRDERGNDRDDGEDEQHGIHGCSPVT